MGVRSSISRRVLQSAWTRVLASERAEHSGSWPYDHASSARVVIVPAVLSSSSSS